MEIHFAPMEGLVDPLVRDVWTRLPGFSLCTTEFIRVTTHLLPEHVFHRECPELLNASRTSSGVPVAVQLLGGDPGVVSENAARAAELGAHSIDLNFGCPAPTVNRHDGGAVLLQFPERISKIVGATRRAVRSETPVTVKLRLGFMDTELCLENCIAAVGGGIARLVVHCRTKKDFYHPPARWHWIPEIRGAVRRAGYDTPIFANGEIWSLEDFKRCQAETQADGYVIGRGAIADPFLPGEITAYLGQSPMDSVSFPGWAPQLRRDGVPLKSLDLRIDGESLSLVESGRDFSPADQPILQDPWSRRFEFLKNYLAVCLEQESERYALTRFKQTLRFMEPRWPEARALFQSVKRVQRYQLPFA